MTREDIKVRGQGPSAPAQKNKAAVTKHELDIATVSSKIVGPSPSQHHSGDEQSQSSDDNSDDDFGPQLPPPTTEETGDSNCEESSRSTPYVTTESTTTRKRERDDWMVKPPDNTSWASGMNPATLTNRKFMTGKSAQGDKTSGGSGSVWTESPAQKRQRLENEVLGIKGGSDTRPTGPRDLSSRKNMATADKVKSISNKDGRSSLYESHQRDSNKGIEDDPATRAFSWEKDIAGQGSISSTNRKKMVNQATGYTSKFSGGKYI